MAKIISIGTAVPAYQHLQEDILHFMQDSFDIDDVEKRKLKFLYAQSSIGTRYSVIADFSQPKKLWDFIPTGPAAPFPNLDRRMEIYDKEALPLSITAIGNCLKNKLEPKEITHLITVSCTGMSAPGLDLQIAEQLALPPTIFRTSVNFLGCYAAIHALKLAKLIADSSPTAKVLVVCTELCTIHFQKEYTADNACSSLLFSDGCAAALITGDKAEQKGVTILSFYSEIAASGKGDMSWKLSSNGFLMSLSSYVADIIKQDIKTLATKSLQQNNLNPNNITHWCIHPGGRKILEAVEQAMQLHKPQLQDSYHVLGKYGNMSSPTILFVLKEIMAKATVGEHVFGCAFGPGLTMETFTGVYE
ncbi:type III polyketide synthase [Parasediminibacterium sp. JCM 36343]|uniref:type III polyketide synthase n=1 Tax=Parasediminibacterium sp. JCM 36343 TaxID=3374279 RepID=UPI003977EC5F